MSADGELPISFRDAVAGGWFDYSSRSLCPGFDIPVDGIVLDAGCGNGRMAAFCAPIAAQLILIDIDRASVEEAVAYTRARGAVQVEGHVSDCAPIPLGDAKADRIICTETLEHVQDPAQVLRELVRVAKPGALFLLTVPAPGAEQVQQRVAPDFYWREPHHLRIFTSKTFEDLVVGSGLVVEERGSYGFFQTVWWSMFWACGTPLEGPNHPALQAWEASWSALLNLPDGARVKRALDEVLPKSQLILARKT